VVSAKYILAVDHGTSGIKTALVSTNGEVAAFAFEATHTLLSPGGGAEQDPEEWWQALLATSKRVLSTAKIPAEQIAGVCVSSTFSTTVAVDGDGLHLANALTWLDSRAAPHVRRLMGGFPSIRGYGLRNVLRWMRKTGGGPALSGKDDLAHVLFVKNEWPTIYAATRYFLPSKDYLNARLTGRIGASYDSMHLFWVTDIRDAGAIRYDRALIAAAGIDAAKLPPLHSATDVLAPLRVEVADELGLGRDTPVIVGSPDHQSACIGSGAIGDYDCHLYVGTSSWIECMVPFKRTDLLHSIASFPTSIMGRYQCVNEQDLAGGCLSFLADNILFHGGYLAARDPNEDRFSLFDRIAAGVEPGSGGVIFTPWLNGERTPVDDASLRGGIHNLSQTTTLDHIVRAVMEGVAYNTRWSLGYVERFIGRRIARLRIVGGGAVSDVWCRIFADVVDREIEAVRDPLQTNARGAAFIAAVALGLISFGDVGRLVPVERRYRPESANRATYDGLYRAFRALHRGNRAVHRALDRKGTSG
jgi:xylulokinase